MKLKLPDSIASIQDLHSLIDEIKEYLKWVSHEETKKQFGAKKISEQPQLSSSTSQLLRVYGTTKSLTSNSVQGLIKELDDFAKNSTSINIILATPAPASVKAKLVSWCRKNIASDVLVNFQFNSSILGGMVVRFGSRIFDWSFRRKIITNRSNILKALDNVR